MEVLNPFQFVEELGKFLDEHLSHYAKRVWIRQSTGYDRIWIRLLINPESEKYKTRLIIDLGYTKYVPGIKVEKIFYLDFLLSIEYSDTKTETYVTLEKGDIAGRFTRIIIDYTGSNLPFLKIEY